jgi:hypothetical protein
MFSEYLAGAISCHNKSSAACETPQNKKVITKRLKIHQIK